MSKPILVTGAAGFIGFHMVNRLCSKGHNVIGIDNLNTYYDVNLKNDRLEELKRSYPKLFKFYKIDISEINALNELNKKYDFNFIIHLAAQAGVRYSIENPNEYIKSNIQGFLNILELCRHNNINKIIYASSSSVYGNCKKYPTKEKDINNSPLSLYGASKISNEIMAHSYSNLFGINTIGLRFFTVYGPWGRPDMALFKFTNNIIKNKPIDIYNNGLHARSFTYVEDIVESIFRLYKLLLEENNLSGHEIFNIGGENSIKLMEYIEIIENKLNKKAKFNYLPLQPGDVVKSEADSSLLEKLISYKPTTDVKDGISQFIGWYKSYYK